MTSLIRPPHDSDHVKRLTNDPVKTTPKVVLYSLKVFTDARIVSSLHITTMTNEWLLINSMPVVLCKLNPNKERIS